MIKLFALRDEKIVWNYKANDDVTLDKVCEIAEKMMESGYATYVQVTVDDEIYMELEA